MKWIIKTGLLVLVVGAVAFYWRLSDTLYKKHPFQNRGFTVNVNADLEEGRRRASIGGCFTACHGEGGKGADFYGMSAPNLTRLSKEYSDAELERVVRQGIRRDGTSVFLMSSDMFQYLTDDDLSDIIAFLRSVPVERDAVPYRAISFDNWMSILRKDLKPKAEMITLKTPLTEADKEGQINLGRYVAMTSCPECHGVDLKGLYGPNLIVASAYEYEDFKKVFYEGLGIGDRNLDMMWPLAESNFSKFTEEEIKALLAYFKTDDFIEKMSEDDEG